VKKTNLAKVIRFTSRRGEIKNVERLVGPSRMRGLPSHAMFTAVLHDDTAGPEMLAAAEVSRRQWEPCRERVPVAAGAVAPHPKMAAARRGKAK
jgi:hypothetical protein